MMASKVVVFALLLVSCCYAQPLRVAVYGSPLLAVPVLVEDLEEPRAIEEPIYALDDNSETPNSFNIVKRSAQEVEDDDDLETAAGTNVLRPLFVYRQQVAYRQRVREAHRRGKRI